MLAAFGSMGAAGAAGIPVFIVMSLLSGGDALKALPTMYAAESGRCSCLVRQFFRHMQRNRAVITSPTDQDVPYRLRLHSVQLSRFRKMLAAIQ